MVNGKRLSTQVVLGLVLAGLGCGASEDVSESTGYLTEYGVSWRGPLEQLPSGEAVLVSSCRNDDCVALRVPVAGLAPPSSWQVPTAAEPAEGAATQLPQAATWQPPGPNECRTVDEHAHAMGVFACAVLRDGADGQFIELSVFLDLTALEQELRTGDTVALVVGDEEDGRALLERTDVVEDRAPYRSEIDLESPP